MAEAESRSDGILSDSPGFQLFKEGRPPDSGSGSIRFCAETEADHVPDP